MLLYQKKRQQQQQQQQQQQNCVSLINKLFETQWLDSLWFQNRTINNKIAPF